MRRRNVSGRECIKILVKHFCFVIKRRAGSHVVLHKQTPTKKLVTVVPDHKELALGTLKSILRLAKVAEEDFFSYT